jgi:hypothetical protein
MIVESLLAPRDAFDPALLVSMHFHSLIHLMDLKHYSCPAFERVEELLELEHLG